MSNFEGSAGTLLNDIDIYYSTVGIEQPKVYAQYDEKLEQYATMLSFVPRFNDSESEAKGLQVVHDVKPDP